MSLLLVEIAIMMLAAAGGFVLWIFWPEGVLNEDPQLIRLFGVVMIALGGTGASLLLLSGLAGWWR